MPTKVYPWSEMKGSCDRNTDCKFIELNLEIRSSVKRHIESIAVLVCFDIKLYNLIYY